MLVSTPALRAGASVRRKDRLLNQRIMEIKMRTAEISRQTNETQIEIKLDLDGTGKHEDRDGCGLSRPHAHASCCAWAV